MGCFTSREAKPGEVDKDGLLREDPDSQLPDFLCQSWGSYQPLVYAFCTSCDAQGRYGLRCPQLDPVMLCKRVPVFIGTQDLGPNDPGPLAEFVDFLSKVPDDEDPRVTVKGNFCQPGNTPGGAKHMRSLLKIRGILKDGPKGDREFYNWLRRVREECGVKTEVNGKDSFVINLSA